MVVLVHHHGEVRTQAEGKERPVPAQRRAEPGASPRSSTHRPNRTRPAASSPVAQLGEEQVRRKVSSQPGQAAQHRQPGQAGQAGQAGSRCRFPPRNASPKSQEGPGHHHDQGDEEEGQREGGKEGEKGRMREGGVECGEKTSEHGGVKSTADEDGFYQAWRPWRGQRSGVCVRLSV